MIYVPEKFQPKHPFPYPPDNHIEFERWYYENYDFQETEREYLPIMFTAYYCRHKFGQDKKAMDALQVFLNKLDRSKKYYSLIQYDGGLLHDVSHLDIKIFSMSGGRTDYPLPLISQEHMYASMSVKRRYLYNFVGNVTHDIRKPLIELAGKPGSFIRTQKHSIQAFCSVLMQSVFTLCPRGYGPTSFRIQEALQYGSIPVYISDEWVIPHNLPFTDYGVLIDAAGADRVHEILMSITAEEIARKQAAIPEVYSRYYTYEGCRDMIKQALKCESMVRLAFPFVPKD